MEKIIQEKEGTLIKISNANWVKLNSMKMMGESFDEVLSRILNNRYTEND